MTAAIVAYLGTALVTAIIAIIIRRRLPSRHEIVEFIGFCCMWPIFILGAYGQMQQEQKRKKK